MRSRREAFTRNSSFETNRLAGAIVSATAPSCPSLVQAFADAKLLTENRAELLFPSWVDCRAVRRGAHAGHGADLRLQRRLQGANHRGRARRRAQSARGLRGDARVLPAAARAGPRWSGLWSWRAGGWRSQKCSHARGSIEPSRPRHGAAGWPDGGDAEQDRTLQDGEGRPRHSRRRAADWPRTDGRRSRKAIASGSSGRACSSGARRPASS